MWAFKTLAIMKKEISRVFTITFLAALSLFSTSCQEILDLEPTTELGAEAFWKTEKDAYAALMGAYASSRGVFFADYLWDGMGEFQKTHNSRGNGAAYEGNRYRGPGYLGSHNPYYEALYGAVHRVNYVIENITLRMLPDAPEASLQTLNEMIAEARFLRGLVYHRLISMYGDVPYIDHIVYDNSEVADALRTPIGEVKNSIIEDLTFAVEMLPDSPRGHGRAAKPAALAFRGKTHLYWASWNNFGWPELAGFTPSPTEAQTAYAAAAADFKSVIEDFNLDLFRGGEPGEIDELGKAEILPNYFYLFLPEANGDPEILFAFSQGGIGTGQSEQIMRHIGSRSHEGSQLWVHPRYEIVDRYQSIETGDFVEPLIPMNPTNNPDARTTPGSAVNPQSYANRDYRMKGTIMWDYEMSIGLASKQSTGWTPFIYQNWATEVEIDGQTYMSYNDGGGNNSGIVYRKFLRNYPGLGRSEGDYNFPLMLLPDVYLMYAEATNEVNGPQADAIELVNRIRHRGNLPPLSAEKISGKEAFFSAIEQERIIELFGEGHRGFDLRRWRAIERVWNPPYGDGVWRIDTHGANRQRYYQNSSEREYEQPYIFRIPPGE